MSNRKQAILKVLVLTFILNLIISLLKLTYGYLSNTFSIIADGFHSLMDSTSNIVGFIAITYAYKPPDKEHPYGHSKTEVMAAMFIAILLAFTCFEVIQKLMERLSSTVIPSISWISFTIMLVSMIVNTFVATYESRKGKELASPILVSDAEHTRSDVLVSFSVLFSLIGIYYGFYWLDIVVSCGIIIFIGKTAYTIFKQNMLILIDTTPLDPLQIEKIVNAIPGIKNCHKIRSHGTPEMIFVDLHIWVNPEMSVTQAHQLSHLVKQKLLSDIAAIKDVTIHIEPDQIA